MPLEQCLPGKPPAASGCRRKKELRMNLPRTTSPRENYNDPSSLKVRLLRTDNEREGENDYVHGTIKIVVEIRRDESKNNKEK